jgi:3-isopropylmalate/(R)-2-methylmalate dehydratase small subunit
MERIIRGRVWKFGHNVDTDVMAPWNSLGLPWEERRRVVLHTRPEFAEQVREGDVIVAGRNWGCGSSREHAPENLKRLGVAAVVAESFGRIYFRNSVAIAFPNIACPGVHDAFDDGEELELDLLSARVSNRTRAIELRGQPYAPEMVAILEKGGLLKVLEERLGRARAST